MIQKRKKSILSCQKSVWYILKQVKTFLRILLIAIALIILLFDKEALFSCLERKKEGQNQSSYSISNNSPARVSAYIRFKNEIKTLPAMLTSIDGVFDKIVMIHSNEPDDGSIAYANGWCAKRKTCEIHMYPHTVIPSHDPRYGKKKVAHKNTLAAYYEFGLQFFEPEEYVVKIDADQVYLTEALEKAMNDVRAQDSRHKKISYGLKGYNTFVYHNQIVSYRPNPFNGGPDSFIIKRKHIQGFIQKRFWEYLLKEDLDYKQLPGYYWFHFMKSLKAGGNTKALEESEETERLPLTPAQQLLFDQEIRPLLKQTASPYQGVSF